MNSTGAGTPGAHEVTPGD